MGLLWEGFKRRLQEEAPVCAVQQSSQQPSACLPEQAASSLLNRLHSVPDREADSHTHTLTPDPHKDGKEHRSLVVKQMGLLEEKTRRTAE